MSNNEKNNRYGNCIIEFIGDLIEPIINFILCIIEAL
jgi:hypothetical protein